MAIGSTMQCQRCGFSRAALQLTLVEAAMNNNKNALSQSPTVTTIQIAAALDISERPARWRADKEGWQPAGRAGRGGGKVYDPNYLPRAVQEKVKDYLHDQQIKEKFDDRARRDATAAGAGQHAANSAGDR